MIPFRSLCPSLLVSLYFMNSHSHESSSQVTNQVRSVKPPPLKSYAISAVTHGLDNYANNIWLGEKVAIPQDNEFPAITFIVSEKPTCQVVL